MRLNIAEMVGLGTIFRAYPVATHLPYLVLPQLGRRPGAHDWHDWHDWPFARFAAGGCRGSELRLPLKQFLQRFHRLMPTNPAFGDACAQDFRFPLPRQEQHQRLVRRRIKLDIWTDAPIGPHQSTPYLVGVCVNRIGTLYSSEIVAWAITVESRVQGMRRTLMKKIYAVAATIVAVAVAVIAISPPIGACPGTCMFVSKEYSPGSTRPYFGFSRSS